jgi:mannose-6-phosphate isomerase-like protein (cupin superfamily)
MKRKLLFFGLAAMLMSVSCVQPQSEESQPAEVSAESVEAVEFRDFGPEPLVIDIEQYTLQNETFRTAVWTGSLMRMTVMTLQPGEDIGLELHTTIDQFLRVEQGSGIMMMGDTEENLDFQERVEDDFAIFIPAGKWHNLLNDSDEPLKLYSIYAPVEHPHGTVHETREEGIEHDHDH